MTTRKLKGLFATLLLLAFFCAGPPASEASEQIGVLRSFSGPILIIRADVPVSVYRGLPLMAGDRISIGDRGKGEIEFSDGSKLAIGSNADLNLRYDKAEKRRTIELLSGTMAGEIEPSDEAVTVVVAGNREIATRGAYIEAEHQRGTGLFRLGCLRGEADLTSFVGGLEMTASLSDGEEITAWPGEGLVMPGDFAEGDIFSGIVELAMETPSTPIGEPVAEPVTPPPPEVKEKPARLPKKKEKKKKERAVPLEKTTGLPTQGEFALRLVRYADLERSLPDLATVRDVTYFLATYGIAPASGYWEIEKQLTKEDYCAILSGGESGDCEFLAPEEIREAMITTFPNLFWFSRRTVITPSHGPESVPAAAR